MRSERRALPETVDAARNIPEFPKTSLRLKTSGWPQTSLNQNAFDLKNRLLSRTRVSPRKQDALRERARCSRGDSVMRFQREHCHLAQTATCAPRDVVSQRQWMRSERKHNVLMGKVKCVPTETERETERARCSRGDNEMRCER